MNRPTIKKILNDTNLSESEKIDQIFAVYTASTSKLKTEEDLQKAVENAQNGLNIEETKPYKELLDKYENEVKAHGETQKTLKKEYDDFKAAVDAEKLISAKQSALRKHLIDDKADSKLSALLEKEFDLSKIELDGDKIKDWANVSKPVKEQYADLFTVEEKPGFVPANNPQNTHPDEDLFLKGFNS